MNKILIDNFPYPSQAGVFQKLDDPSVQMEIVHGFEPRRPMPRAIICPRIASDVLQALLIHDRVAIELHAVTDLIQVFGFANTIRLLQSECLEIIDHNGFNPVLAKEGQKYSVVFLQDSGVNSNQNAALNRLEGKIQKYSNQKTEINLLMLEVDRNRKLLDLGTEQAIFNKEIDFDLQNQNLTKAYNIVSKNHEEINPSDIYKVLRLLNINKSLFLSNYIGAVAIKVDGGAKSVLRQKISPVVQSGNSHDPVLVFQEILSEKGIPDLSDLFRAGLLTIDNVLSFRDNIHGEKFRDWFLTTHYNPAAVHQVLLSHGVPQPFLTKLLRFIIPNAIGIANAPLGLLAGAVDSFLIDKILSGWHPNIFLDDILKSEIDNLLKQHDEKTRRDFIKSRFPNVGRNDPCPCGSGKKFKYCCGKGL